MLNEICCGLLVALRMGLDAGVKFQCEDWLGGYAPFAPGGSSHSPTSPLHEKFW